MPASHADQQHALERTRRILAIIKQCAELGEPCPTNSVLAERMGLNSTAQIVRSIQFLEASGMIEVQRGASSRVITICATGARTAGHIELDRSEKLDEFADYLADGATVAEAAKLLNWTTRDGHAALARISRGLGAQAA